MTSPEMRVAVAGAAVVGVAFGMVRYAFGVTLPDVRSDLAMSDQQLGLIASGTFAGYLCGLLMAMPLAARKGPRAPTTVGGACGVVGALVVAVAPSPLLLAAGATLAGTAAGWVWAPYSDIVPRVAPVHLRARMLSVVNTGTSMGFLTLAAFIVLAAVLDSWRLVWVGTAAAAAAAAVLNLRYVPRLEPRATLASTVLRVLVSPGLLPVLLYAAVYSAGCTVYFTYANQSISDAGLPRVMGAVLFLALATSGVSALWTDRVAARIGTAQVAALCVGAQGVALGLLATAHGSVSLTVASSLVYGVGYMAGGTALAIWTAEALPASPGEGFTAALLVGAVSAIAAPTVVGALTPVYGLSALLFGAGAVATAAGLSLATHSRLAALPR